MKAWIFLAALFFSTSLQAEELGASCPDLSVALSHSKEELSKFFGSLQAAAGKKDFSAISKLVNYPLRVYSKPKQKPIRTEAGLMKAPSKVFTDKVLAAITSQKFENLFCRDQGVMIGDGEVWISEANGKLGISTINQ